MDGWSSLVLLYGVEDMNWVSEGGASECSDGVGVAGVEFSISEMSLYTAEDGVLSVICV